jgi:ferritin-like protein
MFYTPLIRINQLFADSVFTNYRKKRYGLKKCKTAYDPEYLNDMRELLKRSTELEQCEKKLGGCSITKIEETIKTL